MKKVLMLSCSTGQGHNASAEAVKEYIIAQGISCDMIDSLNFISGGFAKFMSWGHSYMYRNLPWLFKWGYRYTQKHPKVLQNKSLVHRLLTTGKNRLYQYITKGGYDTVICTHEFSAIMLTQMLKEHPLDLKTAFVVTDYTCYPGIDAFNVAHYFIPNAQLIDAFCASGIPAEKIKVSGIPIHQSFFASTNQRDAKIALGIDPDKKMLLIMCGSMGCGPIPKILKHFVKKMPANTEISVICGTNKRLYNKLRRKYKKISSMHVIGYTNQVPLYMDATDLYLTKPGGISVTEAATKKCPMAFVNAVAGCEQYNMDFFSGMGAAIYADTPESLALESVRLLSDEDALKKMRQALQNYRQPDGAKSIFEHLN